MLLLAGDLVYVAIHLIWIETTLLQSPLAALDTDRGYAEFFQYMKLLWACLLLTFLTFRTKRRGYLVWVLVFAYLLVDDLFSLHENLGRMLADGLAMQDAFRMRAVDFGELLQMSAAGAVLAVAIGWAYLRGGSHFRRSSRHLLVLMVAVVLFGVVLDMVHVAIGATGRLDDALVILEDGGELVVTSFIAWYALFLVVVGDSSEGPSFTDLVGVAVSNWVTACRPARQPGTNLAC